MSFPHERYIGLYIFYQKIEKYVFHHERYIGILWKLYFDSI